MPEKTGMKLIVSGSRTLGECPAGAGAEWIKRAEEERAEVHKVLAWITKVLPVRAVLHGACPTGVDSIAHQWAVGKFKIILFPADWNRDGKKAGPLRNKHMAVQGDFLVAIWDGKSAGTKSMIAEARKAGVHSYIHYMTGPGKEG